MISPQPNVEAISAFTSQLSPVLLTAASVTHFPVQLPLSFATSLHHINLLCVLHIVEAAYLHPAHSAYLAAAGITAHDATLRGVMGAFLASDEAWDSQNLLSAAAWQKGVMTEERISDIFAIEVMREQDHETMKGVKVGGRWEPGVRMAGDLIGLFKRLGDSVRAMGGQCVGEVAIGALKKAQEGVQGVKGDKAPEFARIFCDQAVHFERSLADPYPTPTGKIMPAAPLKLLQDLAHVESLKELGVTLPKAKDFEDVSPLPLPVSLIVNAGLVDLIASRSASSSDPLASPTLQADLVKDAVASLNGNGNGMDGANRIQAAAITLNKLPLESVKALQTASVEVCREIWATARFTNDKEPDADWKTGLSLLDVYRIATIIEGYRRAGRRGAEVVADSS